MGWYFLHFQKQHVWGIFTSRYGQVFLKKHKKTDRFLVSPETVASYRRGWWWFYPDVWGKFACGENLPTLTLINFRSCAKSCRDEHEIWVRQIHHSWVADPFIATPRKNHHRRSSWGKEKTHLRCTHGKWSLWRRISPNAKLKMKRWLLWWNASCNWVPDTVPHPSFFR